jgi:hypothetical protein
MEKPKLEKEGREKRGIKRDDAHCDPSDAAATTLIRCKDAENPKRRRINMDVSEEGMYSRSRWTERLMER